MRWLMRDLWKAGITMTGILFLLVVMVWLPVSAAGTHERARELDTSVTVQTTPTEDATVTELNKEKLAQEVLQLKNQNEPDPFGWLRTNVAILFSTLAVVFGALFGLWRWLVDRRDAQDKELEDRKAEREKRAEERFQSVVEGLGSTGTATQVGAAIMLRTFLRPGYEQFYSQVFDLAVAYLWLRNIGSEPEPPDSFNQALIKVFRESFPLARDLLKQSSQPLDALGVRLDRAYLIKSDLRSARMPESYLRKARLVDASLSAINLRDANLSGADLRRADLREATLRRADLKEANLSSANLSSANLSGADLSSANLSKADLSEANLGDARLDGTDLRRVKGLAKEQLETCKAKGAIIDEDPTTSSSQSTFLPPPPSQSNNLQAQVAPSAQGSALTSNEEGSSATSSKPRLES